MNATLTMESGTRDVANSLPHCGDTYDVLPSFGSLGGTIPLIAIERRNSKSQNRMRRVPMIAAARPGRVRNEHQPSAHPIRQIAAMPIAAASSWASGNQSGRQMPRAIAQNKAVAAMPTDTTTQPDNPMARPFIAAPSVSRATVPWRANEVPKRQRE